MKKILRLLFFIVTITFFAQTGRAQTYSYPYDDTPHKGIYNGMRPACKDGKCGFVDSTGKIIVPFIYDVTAPFSEGLGRVEKDNKVGFVDNTGKIVIPLTFTYATFFSQGLCSARKEDGGKLGYIDHTGKTVIPFVYDWGDGFGADGTALVSKDGVTMNIDIHGKEIK